MGVEYRNGSGLNRINPLVLEILSEKYEDFVNANFVADIMTHQLDHSQLEQRLNFLKRQKELRGGTLPPHLLNVDRDCREQHEGDPTHTYEGLLTSDGIIGRLTTIIQEHANEDLRVFHHHSCVPLPGHAYVECLFARAHDGEEKRVYHMPMHRAVLEPDFDYGSFMTDVTTMLGGNFHGRQNNYRLV